MAQNLKLDPAKRDYIVIAGSPVPTNRVFEKAYFALAIPRLKYLYGTGEGSDLNLFQNTKRVPETDQLYAARARQAIEGQLVASGEVASVEVTNIATSRQGTSNNIVLQPNQQSLSTQLAFEPV